MEPECRYNNQMYSTLHRPVCGIRGKTLIINLPGSKKGSQVRLLEAFAMSPKLIRSGTIVITPSSTSPGWMWLKWSWFSVLWRLVKTAFSDISGTSTTSTRSGRYLDHSWEGFGGMEFWLWLPELKEKGIVAVCVLPGSCRSTAPGERKVATIPSSSMSWFNPDFRLMWKKQCLRGNFRILGWNLEGLNARFSDRVIHQDNNIYLKWKQ